MFHKSKLQFVTCANAEPSLANDSVSPFTKYPSKALRSYHVWFCATHGSLF